jgi:hypothetical protein
MTPSNGLQAEPDPQGQRFGPFIEQAIPLADCTRNGPFFGAIPGDG